jgi:hypothetical protein
MEKINLNKKVYSKNQYEKVINTNFTQLATSPTPQNTPPPVNTDVRIAEFFQQYEDLFFQIPKLGTTNSHEYLIKKSTEYVGSVAINDDVQALIEEINLLQQQNLELNQQLVELQIPNNGQNS